ncbi:MAG: arginine--tRNA ligase [Chitinophagaceae bacterium]|nr:arginine--tRNA ligase [Chitinophagaceae bacterium]
MDIVDSLQKAVVESLQALYSQYFTEKDFQVSQTKPEFTGDYTVVLFSLVKQLKKSPEELGDELGEQLVKNNDAFFSGYNVIKGFLNLIIRDSYLLKILQQNYSNIDYGKKALGDKKMMVEYSSPNTNKPLHLGHLRNNFLGWSVAEILKANGYDVIKTCVVNDRGIHICKSMLAWQLYADGATPASTHIKGDHFVGDYYVKFNDEFKKEVEALKEKGVDKEEAEKQAPIMQQTQKMLVDWEENKPEVKTLWKKMNTWVYEGFDITYKRIGSNFDRIYYESETYLLGRDIVKEGLLKKIFYNKEDGSVWVNLEAYKLDEKLVLRNDGTSVYITQDIGLAEQKFEEYKPDKSIYVIGDEQIHHMKVLKAICKKLGLPFADDIHHLSYGMVELPGGKMKSREGTVVDADDLVDEMIATSKKHTEELGKVKDFNEEELHDLFEIIGLGAMKFYLLRVDPKKKMVFNPEESIDFHGFTGPFVQYTFARIQSILRKVGFEQVARREKQVASGEKIVASGEKQVANSENLLLPLEKQLILILEQYAAVIEQAANELNPSVIANYVFHIAQTFNSFYTAHSIANAETNEKKQLRTCIAVMTGNIIKSAMQLLGIRVPDRM